MYPCSQDRLERSYRARSMHMTKHRGSEGGAADEAGGQYRRAVAALFAAHGLNGISFEGLPLGGDQATVEGVALETDNPVDDVLVQFAAGRLFIQAKRTITFGRRLL